MRRLKLSFATGILTIAFTVSTTIAGQMPMGITAPPPPTENSAAGQMPMGVTSSEDSAAGNMPYGDTAEIDPVTGLALSLLKSLLSLF